jgi:hypothetical protein
MPQFGLGHWVEPGECEPNFYVNVRVIITNFEMRLLKQIIKNSKFKTDFKYVEKNN